MTKAVDVNLINGIALAFEGDAVYSMYVRRHLIFKGLTKPNKLHGEANKYVSAKAQAGLISALLEAQLLTEKEEEIYKRGAIPIATPRPRMRTWSPIGCPQALRRSWDTCT